MEPTKMNGYDNNIIVNFRHKKESSPDALEVVAYNKLVNYNNKSVTVESREEANEWLNKLYDTTTNAIRDIFDIKASSVNENGEPISAEEKEMLIEQQRMKVLFSANWVYRGSFLRDAHKTRVNSRGEKKKISDAHPELSYMVSVVNIGGRFYYSASYGIMHGSDSPEYGSYSYYPTLKEAIEFLKEQFNAVGKEVFFERINRNEAFRHLNRIGKKKPGKSDIDHALRDTHKKSAHLAKMLTADSVVERSIHNLKSSMDIFTLPDLIDRFLFEVADNLLMEAREFEFRQKQAALITDTDVVDLDIDEEQLQISENSYVGENPVNRVSMEPNKRVSQFPKDNAPDDNRIGTAFNVDSSDNTVIDLDESGDDPQWSDIVKDSTPQVVSFKEAEKGESDDKPSHGMFTSHASRYIREGDPEVKPLPVGAQRVNAPVADVAEPSADETEKAKSFVPADEDDAAENDTTEVDENTVADSVDEDDAAENDTTEVDENTVADSVDEDDAAENDTTEVDENTVADSVDEDVFIEEGILPVDVELDEGFAVSTDDEDHSDDDSTEESLGASEEENSPVDDDSLGVVDDVDGDDSFENSDEDDSEDDDSEDDSAVNTVEDEAPLEEESPAVEEPGDGSSANTVEDEDPLEEESPVVEEPEVDHTQEVLDTIEEDISELMDMYRMPVSSKKQDDLLDDLNEFI